MAPLDPPSPIHFHGEPLFREKDVNAESTDGIDPKLSLKERCLVGFQLEREQLARIVGLPLPEAHRGQRHFTAPSQHRWASAGLVKLPIGRAGE